MKEGRLPPAVVPGDVVGVAALSSIPDRDALETGIGHLERMGFRVQRASNLEQSWHLFAGEDQARVSAFHELVAATEVRAVVFARGGHGCLRALPLIDWNLLAAQPKAYVGYSDLTPLLLQIVERLGLVTFHGPMVATDLARGLDDAEERSLCSSLEGRPMDLPCAPLPAARDAEGVLLGGCLSLLAATLGTPFAPDLSDALLFLEDVNEPLYRVDRMLTQLQLSGSLKKVKTMILGHLELTDPNLPEPLPHLLTETVRGAPMLAATGLPCGHGVPNLTVPLGVRARLASNEGRIELRLPEREESRG